MPAAHRCCLHIGSRRSKRFRGGVLCLLGIRTTVDDGPMSSAESAEAPAENLHNQWPALASSRLEPLISADRGEPRTAGREPSRLTQSLGLNSPGQSFRQPEVRVLIGSFAFVSGFSALRAPVHHCVAPLLAWLFGCDISIGRRTATRMAAPHALPSRLMWSVGELPVRRTLRGSASVPKRYAQR